MTWKWLEGWEAERNEFRREDESEGKSPTRRTWTERGSERERRDEMREGI